MNDFTVIFNGVDLSPYLRVTEDFRRGIGTTRTNHTLQVGAHHFKRYTGYSLDEKIIEMPFVVRNDLINKRRELARILNVSEPAQLIFTDEPDKYYMALPTGDIDVSEKRFLGFGTITWQIPDGVAYSVQAKEATNRKKDVLDIYNSGTFESFPKIEVQMTSDNGFVGFINDEGALLQFGDPDEVNGVAYEKSEYGIIDICGVNFWEDTFAKSKWRTNEGFVVQYKGMECKQSGSGLSYDVYNISYDPWAGQKFPSLRTISYGTGEGWHGPSITRPFTPDSEGKDTAKNWTFEIGQFFISGSVEQAGMQQWLVNTPEGKNVAGIIFVKSNTSAHEMTCCLVINGQVVKEIPSKSFTGNMLTGWWGGSWKVDKFNNQFTFTTPSGIFSFNNSAAANLEGKFITFYAAQWKTLPAMAVNIYTSCRFQKHNVEKWIDIPNKFGEYDVLSIDTGKGTVLLNGLETPGLGALGNDWEQFMLKTGENQIHCLYSEFSKKPEMKISFNEVFL
ncbi:phage tail family protein [Enterococcus sp. BWT-B8]|uniref:distal tail protein Dit n=1 Tax=Enterococcus sp. BWT-B8 TaxID=2885157 RepID=UPI001E6122DC|nr:distal tail protein Dit [Enterococcus sp. BWT-B8]MCB5952947.1 phage tail family protein [Enterococcus sp. BWT-B8]